MAVWWAGLAGTAAVAGTMSALAAFDVLTIATMTLLTRLVVLVFSFACAGLVFHLFQAATGSSRMLIPIALTYGLFNLIQNAEYTRNPPISVDVEGWRPALVLANPPHPAFQLVSFALLLAPPILGAVGRLIAAWHAGDGLTRFRHALSGAAIVAWTGGVLVIGLPVELPHDLLQLGARLAFLLSAAGFILAEEPPAWLVARLGGGNLQMPPPASPAR